MKYRHHIFICINERKNSERKSCGEANGMELVSEFKKRIKEAGLNAEIRAQRAGCLDACDFGPSVVVYPEGVFYGSLSLADVPEIVQQHLVLGKPVERLIIRFNKSSTSN